MKTDLAIELLHGLQGDTPEQLATPTQKAIRLGIEALKASQLPRRSPYLTPKERAVDALYPMMTPEKAIELLSDCRDRNNFTLCLDFYEAVRLGRDALIHTQLEATLTSRKEG